MPTNSNAPIAPNEVESPIINSPFREPDQHWRIEKGKSPVQATGRRPASYFYRVPEISGRGRKTKGRYGDDADIKPKAAERWVNEDGEYRLWRYVAITDPSALPDTLNEYALAKWDRDRSVLESTESK